MNNMLHKCSLVIICGTYIITLNSFCVPVYGNIREIRSPQTNWWQESQSQQQNPNGNVVEEKLDSQSSQQRKNDFVLIYNKGNNTLVEVRGKWSTRSGDDTLNNSPQEFSNTSNGNTYNEYDNSLSPPILSSHEERPEQPSPPSVPLPSLPLPQLPHEYWPPPRPPLPPPPHGSPLAPALHLGLPPPPYVKQLFDSQYRERNGQQLNYYRRPPPVPPPPPPLLYDQLYYQGRHESNSSKGLPPYPPSYWYPPPLPPYSYYGRPLLPPPPHFYYRPPPPLPFHTHYGYPFRPHFPLSSPTSLYSYYDYQQIPQDIKDKDLLPHRSGSILNNGQYWPPSPKYHKTSIENDKFQNTNFKYDMEAEMLTNVDYNSTDALNKNQINYNSVAREYEFLNRPEGNRLSPEYRQAGVPLTDINQDYPQIIMSPSMPQLLQVIPVTPDY
ncbi:actin-binding protein WASF2-like isoform X3 [Galleria mellonella]|uniref:Actin-binding protein WASF2-like isoform X3 n=1 Tax=Galleria mellonella TaxID=7137 RepID=A0A6J3BTK8_GALME|nr:actin-binding protein WASF2-like isoform X3 [Galleria mellonella]XP_031763267.2 actin-binding protein WASF2-like isoform X3 [Galleria mellonella]